MQCNVFHKNHGMLYGNVAVTFVVQMAFNFLIQGIFKRTGINGEPNLMWSGIFFLVRSDSPRAAASPSGERVLSTGAILLPAAIPFILALIAIRDFGQAPKSVDPWAGGIFA